MTIIEKYLRKVGFLKKTKPCSQDVESLRTAFQARYHNFKLLLNANNKALQVMSEIEEACRGATPFGMSFIRAHCTAASVNVFRMIKSMDELAPGKYDALQDGFRSIQTRIAEILSEKKEPAAGPLVIRLCDADKTMADEVGNKMSNLGEIRRLGLRVPNGFVISARAFRQFMKYSDLQVEIDRLLQSSSSERLDGLFTLSAQIQQQIILARIPVELETAVYNAYAELEALEGQGVKVSLRSSALGEDSIHSSFAGLYRSELNVSADHVLQAYKEVAASMYSLQAIAYRLNKGIRDEDINMCVGCMCMVNAVAGGVIYSRNPVDVHDERIFIHSVFGLPKSVVDGSVATDLFVVSRNPFRLVEQRIAEKRHKFICYPDEGVCRFEIAGEESSKASISEAAAIDLAAIALRIEKHFGVAQDVEWAIDEKGEIILLQCRPLIQRSMTSRAGEAAFDLPQHEVLISGGTTASPGAGFGPVFVIKKESEALLFPEGSVLVVKQALPRWAALLGRAVALISEQGSPAGHLANVAREFGVPAIMGLHGAADLLKNGVPVTVDADGLRVYAGEVKSFIEKKRSRKP